MPLPMPVFLMPQARPATWRLVELVLQGQQAGAHADAGAQDLAGGGHAPGGQGVVVAELPAVEAALLAEHRRRSSPWRRSTWLTPKPRMAPQGRLLV